MKGEPKNRGRPCGAAERSREVVKKLQKQPPRKRGRPLKIAKNMEPEINQKKDTKQVSVSKKIE